MTYPTEHDIATAVEAFREIEQTIGLMDIGEQTAAVCGLTPIDGHNEPVPFGQHEGFRFSDGRDHYPYDGPTIICLSVGYANVYSDGGVGAGCGHPVFYVDSDGRAEGPQS